MSGKPKAKRSNCRRQDPADAELAAARRRFANYTTYTAILEHPAIDAARSTLLAAATAVQWDFQAEPLFPEASRVFVERTIRRLTRPFVSDAFTAMDYGCKAFEVVWNVESGRLVISRLKPLSPWMTVVLVDEVGNFAGITIGEVVLGTEKSLWVWAGDDGMPVSYGRSRLENVRPLWEKWQQEANIPDVDQRLRDAYLGHAGSPIDAVWPLILSCEKELNRLINELVLYNFGSEFKDTCRVVAVSAMPLGPSPPTEPANAAGGAARELDYISPGECIAKLRLGKDGRGYKRLERIRKRCLWLRTQNARNRVLIHRDDVELLAGLLKGASKRSDDWSGGIEELPENNPTHEEIEMAKAKIREEKERRK